MSDGIAYEQDDVVYHLTTTMNVSESEMQRVLDARFPGAFIQLRGTSPNAKQRCKKTFQVGRLFVPPDIANRRRTLAHATAKPETSVAFHLGPYETSIKLYQKPLSTKAKLRFKNEEFEKKLEELSCRLESLQEEKQKDEILLEHVIESNPVKVIVSSSVLSSDKKRANNINLKNRNSTKRQKSKTDVKGQINFLDPRRIEEFERTRRSPPSNELADAQIELMQKVKRIREGIGK